MIERPTPETDAVFPGLKGMPDHIPVYVPIGRLRTLERQRGEARESVCSLEAELETERLSNKRLRAKIDELRERLEEFDDEHEALVEEDKKLERAEAERLKRKVDFLLGLTGSLMIVGGDRDYLEGLKWDEATDDDLDDVDKLMESREREANLRGEVWEGGGL